VVGALLDVNALDRFSLCLDALTAVAGRNAQLAVAQAWAVGAEGILALTVDELLFVDEAQREITGELLADVRTCFVNPSTGAEIVITLDDGSVIEFAIRGSLDDVQWFATAIWSAALPPPPAAAVAPATLRSRLASLRELHDEGLITREDYEFRRRAILEDL
jgi:hypothetical protein